MVKTLFQDNPKTFACFFAGMLLTLLSAVALLNLVANPMAQYPTHVFAPLVQTSRAEKLELVSQLETRPQGLILGSSRVMKLEPDYLEKLTGLSFFNAGVNYGSSEDHLAWFRLYRAKYGCAPEMVIVGIDPSSFSSALPPDARLVNTPELSEQIPEAITWEEHLAVWKDLFSWDQTKLSAKSLARQMRRQQLPQPVEHYRHDGLLVYEQRERQIAEGTYDLAAAIEANKREYLPRYLGFKKQSLQRRRMFLDLAKTCQENQTQLIVYMTPMHPELENYLKAKTEMQQRHEELAVFLGLLAQKYDFQFYNLSSIKSFGGDPHQFVDGTHPLESNTRLILNLFFPHGRISNDYAIQ